MYELVRSAEDDRGPSWGDVKYEVLDRAKPRVDTWRCGRSRTRGGHRARGCTGAVLLGVGYARYACLVAVSCVSALFVCKVVACVSQPARSVCGELLVGFVRVDVWCAGAINKQELSRTMCETFSDPSPLR